MRGVAIFLMTALFAAASVFSEGSKPFRSETCLNGRWRFQPVSLPAGWECGNGVAPELPLPREDGWSKTPLRVPSPWNVNSWGCGTDVGEGTARPFDPDSNYYPSYPEEWRHVRMGWLEKIFQIDAMPSAEERLMVHFEAVAGECVVGMNGKTVGGHFDSYLPFDVDITDCVVPGSNVLQVGIRDHKLFDRKEKEYPYMSAPYPTGSNTDGICGIWQDVLLVRVPSVRVEDIFVKPDVGNDTLSLEVTVRNDTARPRLVEVRAEAEGLSLAGAAVEAPANGTARCEISARVEGRLKPWTPDEPNLSFATVTLVEGGLKIDERRERFGWRQFKIRGRDLLLNGKRIELKGDILHPFGPYCFTPEFVRAWYTMIKDMHGNAVRPHAQVYPRCYLDIADEMGICVLDETAVFGSSIRCNFTMPEFWERWEEHYRGLIMRDRNHPSVFGWSFGNEMFAIFNLNNVPEGLQRDEWYGRIASIGLKAREWDTTREWVSCDGDGDLCGALPVWSKHYGHHPRDVEGQAAGIDKPLMVGENGGTYYARPADLYKLGGEAAYRDYAGRNEALAADVYSNYVCMARGRLAYWSASETAWFGLKPLAFGGGEGVRLEDVGEGVRGVHVERIPAYAATLNPGWDEGLPLYEPFAMFEAQRAAQDPRGPQPCKWDSYAVKPVRPAAPSVPAEGNRLLFVDDEASLAEVNALLGTELELNDRYATQFVRASETDEAVASFTVDELYFAEAGDDESERREAKHCLAGVPCDAVLLESTNTDWTLFNRRPENAKVAAIVKYEETPKPEGVVLAAFPDPDGEGRVFVTTVDRSLGTVRHRHFVKRLCANIGVPCPVEAVGGTDAAGHEHDLLLDGPKE